MSRVFEIEPASPSAAPPSARRAARERLFGDLWDYAPAPESTRDVEVPAEVRHLVGGRFVAGGEPFETANPATGEALSRVPAAGAAEVGAAVAAARAAFEGEWGRLPGAERAKLLYRIGRALQERSRELAVLETLDNGKPIQESRDVDVPLAAAHFLHHAGWADKLEHAFPGARVRPLGVAGQVIPWNFPLLMAAWKVAPALATGNTVVLKPAETSPLTAHRLAEIAQEVGLPPGVLNVVHGGPETGRLVVEHPGVDKVAFTGSTEVGKRIQAALAGTRKRLTLELGGKGANVVFADAPLDQAVEGIVSGIFFNQGHVCCAGSRLLVQESVAAEVQELLLRRVATLRVGDPLDKNTDVGAIHSPAQLARIEELVRSGLDEGAAMHRLACELPERGSWFPPTVFTDVAPAMRIAREEIFGPVLCVETFRTVEEAVAKANRTPYGLASGVWSDKGAKLFAVAGALRTGVVWGNAYNRLDPAAPFGGFKESGFGREGGRHGLLPYLEVRG